jgi:HD domain
LTLVKVGTANENYLTALEFAVLRHAAVKQERKGTEFPYVVHPIRVAEILDRFDYPEDVVVAGFLHDLVEDAGVPLEELRQDFGARVAELISKVSEEDKSLPWRERKEEALAALEVESDQDVLALVAADKLDNVQSLTETLRARGKDTWSIFNAGEGDQRWYYRTLTETLLARDPASRLIRTLDVAVHDVFPAEARRTPFYAGKPFGSPADARAYLADPIVHWRPEYSAYELAHSWIGSELPPAPVHALLEAALGPNDVVAGFFENETPLPTRGRPSQTDLLLVLRSKDGLAVAAVEGKAKESFGQYVKDWDDGSPTKQDRLIDLIRRLGLESVDVTNLRYQLLHRTVAALLEAERFGADSALMIVHAFDEAPDSFRDFVEFTAALGVEVSEKDTLTAPKTLGGVTLRLGWAQDQRR